MWICWISSMFTLPASSTRKRVLTGNVHEGRFRYASEVTRCAKDFSNASISLKCSSMVRGSGVLSTAWVKNRCVWGSDKFKYCLVMVMVIILSVVGFSITRGLRPFNRTSKRSMVQSSSSLRQIQGSSWFTILFLLVARRLMRFSTYPHEGSGDR